MTRIFPRRIVGSSRRWALVLLNLVLHHPLFYRLVGWLNGRRQGLASVFVAYPASAEYASFYFTESLMRKAKWTPILCALMRQNGKWMFGFGISSTEEELRSDVGANLRALVERTERLRQLTGARHMTFSGILPGLLHQRGIINESVEAAVTVRVVAQAVELVRKAEGLPPKAPVIVLGGRGFIGSQLVQVLEEHSVYSVDTSKPNDAWPDHLEGKQAILINVASKHALRQYLDKVWAGLTLLNEVYPEPSTIEVEVFDRYGNKAYHVVGVRAQSWPSFPKAYAGGIPCCAGWPCDELEAIVRRLN